MLWYDLTSSQIRSWWDAQGVFWEADNLMFAIPWDQMQVVAPHSARDW